jgi:hypothetical protein
MPNELTTEDLEYLRHGDRPLLARLFRPRGGGPFPAVIDVHGGAWTNGDRTECQARGEALAAAGLVVAAIDFRQAGDGYPAWGSRPRGSESDDRKVELFQWVILGTRHIHLKSLTFQNGMCGRPLGCKSFDENFDGWVDCDHVSGLLTRHHVRLAHSSSSPLNRETEIPVARNVAAEFDDDISWRARRTII